MALASTSSDAPNRALQMLDTFSMEMTAKDAGPLAKAAKAGVIPAGTRINLTYLATEDRTSRVDAAKLIGELGFTPVPHISARRLGDEGVLREYLKMLAERGATEHLFVVGGDPPEAEGPYEDALAVIRSGVLQDFGVRSVGIGGYPEGHPDITDEVLWRALIDKSAALAEQGLEPSIITQFCFDSDPVLEWVAAVRAREITAPIRIGVPGPAGIKRLLAYAKRFGVGTGAEVVRKYGLSLTNLLGTAGPDKFLHALADGYDPARHGELDLHFYAFGGLTETAEWIHRFRAQEEKKNR